MPNYITTIDDLIVLLAASLESLVQAGTLKRVYYGDTKLVPDYPVALVIPGSKDRPARDGGGSRFFKVGLTAQVVVIHEAIQSIEITDKIVTQRAAAVEAAMEADLTLGGNIIFGWVVRTAPTIAMREKIVHRAHQLTYTGESRQYF